MRQRLASVSLRNPALHLCQEVEALDGVLDCGVGWKLLNCLENLLLDADECHSIPPIRRDWLGPCYLDNIPQLKVQAPFIRGALERE